MSSPHARATIGHATANVTVNTVADGVYLAGDFSGIQRFVLRVKSAGKAQAKRLGRGRFFSNSWSAPRCGTSSNGATLPMTTC